MQDVGITGTGIKLGQFVKLANLVASGGEAKAAIAEGYVTVNGEVESRRGRTLAVGDVVEVGGVSVRVSAEEPEDSAPAAEAISAGEASHEAPDEAPDDPREES